MEEALPPRSCCAPGSAMPWACLERLTSIPPARGNGKRPPPPSTVSVSPRTPSDRRISCSDSLIGGSTSYVKSKSFWRTSTPNGRNARLGGPSGPEMHWRQVTFLPPFPAAGGRHARVDRSGAGERAVNKGADRSRWHCWRCQGEPPGRGEQGCYVSGTSGDPVDDTQHRHCNARGSNVYT